MIDVAPTVLDAAGLPAPLSVNGVQQMPLHGVSMRYAFDDADAAERRRDAVLRDVRQPGHLPQGLDRGHTAQHPVGGHGDCPRSTTTCGSCTRPTTGRRPTTSSAEQPEQLHELQRLFMIEAGKYDVLPLDDRRFERFNAELAGRPQLVKGNSQVLFSGMGRLSENSIIVTKNKSLSITADDHGARRRCQRRAGRAGRRVRRVQPVPARGAPGVLLQPASG